jgi:hypothetical protein
LQFSIDAVVAEAKQYAAIFIEACKDEPETQLCIFNWKDIDSGELHNLCYQISKGISKSQ